jgi:predicted O-methyltransferase YrrM
MSARGLRATERLTWIDTPSGTESRWPSGPRQRFRVGDVEFRCGFGESQGRRFAIRKDRTRTEEYLEFVERFQHDNIVELGIGSGGSIALTVLVAPPRKLVAIDIRPDRVEALDDLIRERGLAERVRLHYGVDQADRERLAAILENEFGEEALGLVVDDASHRLDETRTSFEALFPRLRPGGLFVIEDWNHEHLASRALAEALTDPSPELKAQFKRRLAEGPPDPPLTRLVIELILVNAVSDEFVREVRVGRGCACVYRGSGELDPSTFRVADHVTNDLGILLAD